MAFAAGFKVTYTLWYNNHLAAVAYETLYKKDNTITNKIRLPLKYRTDNCKAWWDQRSIGFTRIDMSQEVIHYH